jgi:two-component system phosphate regulon sensor histidine kinase PhoR
VVRNPELQNFIEQTLAGSEAVESQVIILNEDEERYLQFRGTILRDATGNKIGTVVVFDDVTRLRKLENMRKDFVANVSHELKTPITSIKGFIETLMDGAINDPEDARRFLDIIARQTHRLNAIIDDLLTLSKIEQQTEKTQIQLQSSPLLPTLTAAAQLCEVRATPKDIRMRIDCSEDLTVSINPPLLEQAVVNLIDNAVKYSPEHGEVMIRALPNDTEVLIQVIDRGCGIEPRYLPRLFERFYRVDKARSRKLGGTGLGLAIVKHIVQAHDGRVTVESTPGTGSVFTIHLPIP